MPRPAHANPVPIEKVLVSPIKDNRSDGTLIDDQAAREIRCCEYDHTDAVLPHLVSLAVHIVSDIRFQMGVFPLKGSQTALTQCSGDPRRCPQARKCRQSKFENVTHETSLPQRPRSGQSHHGRSACTSCR
ncbi:hypothetical protein MICRO80W_540009 [Micrococcus luteus]|nr:hypothetical protein MICRO80W_540009 [Micrococcus luteus]